MKPDSRFQGLDKTFWAYVRTLSQGLGYTSRGTGQIKRHRPAEMSAKLSELGLSTTGLLNAEGGPTALALLLQNYFEYRADVLETSVEANLLNSDGAALLYERLLADYTPSRIAPMNKQKGEKKQVAFLTAAVNLLIEQHCQGYAVDYDPRGLTAITKDGAPVRTLSRRVDGAFPSLVDPIAIWEIKEYYYTTTFGSRVADGVYETLLDGMELEELDRAYGRKVQHILFVDSHYTWWVCGRSYLCRLIDMLHMGYVDNVIFGREVVDEVPAIVSDWVAQARALGLPATGTPQPSGAHFGWPG